MTPTAKKITWYTVALAIAAAIIAFVTTMTGGCAMALDGRVASWWALPGKVPPPVPTWATVNGTTPATQPAAD